MNQKVVSKPGDWMGPVAWLFHLIPKNLLSWITGALARIPWPAPLNKMVLGLFVRTFGIDMREAERPLESYRSIEELFIRTLKPGAREATPPVASPADGYLARSAAAVRNQAVQVKGITYDLGEMILGERADPVEDLDLAWYVTVYLAPHNYHRVHTPVAGRLRTIRYIPGELWPVNRPFVRAVPRIFTRNERLVFEIETGGGGRVYAAMVGALNVGRITTPFWEGFASNGASRQLGTRPNRIVFETPPVLELGAEIGTFMLGSTVVLAFDKVAASGFDLDEIDDNRSVKMGQSLVRS